MQFNIQNVVGVAASERTDSGHYVIPLHNKPLSDVAYGFVENDEPDVFVLNVNAEETAVAVVPESVTEIGYWTEGPGTHKSKITPLEWSGLAVLKRIGHKEMLKELLDTVGDVALAQAECNAFTEAEVERFCYLVMAGARNTKKRYKDGYASPLMPNTGAFSVMNLLQELNEDGNLLHAQRKAFVYERISALGVESSDLVFVGDKKIKGQAITGLVYNEDRANVSIRVCQEGVVRLPKDRPAKLPLRFKTNRYRTYTIIRDGVLHTTELPVSLIKPTFDKLKAEGLISKSSVWVANKVYLLKFAHLPILNQDMVKDVKAETAFGNAIWISKLKAKQKVLKAYKAALVAPFVTFAALYGEEGASWLKEHGITETSGFSPKVTLFSTDNSYEATTLRITIAGLSALPSVDSVRGSIAAEKKLKVSEIAMAQAIRRVDKEMADRSSEAFLEWLNLSLKATTLLLRKASQELAQSKFSVLLGQTWFSDLDPGQDCLLMTYTGYPTEVKVTALLESKMVNV